MGLETGTFIDDLVNSNPTGPDGIIQGDNHLRLVKAVLQATFPVANRAFYFGKIIDTAIAYTVLVADDKGIVLADVTSGGFIITLPVGANVPAGFSITVVKDDAGGNLVTVDGNGAETISGAADFTLNVQYDSVTVMWDETEWKIISKIEPAQSTFAQNTEMLFVQASAPTGWTQNTSETDKVLRVVDTAGAGTGGSWTISGVSVDAHQLTVAEMPAHAHASGSSSSIAGGDSVPTSKRSPNATGADGEIVGGDGTHVHGLTSDAAWRPAYQDVIVATKD